MNQIFRAAALVLLGLSPGSYCSGEDMWSNPSESKLYSPHVNNCDTTEVFIRVGGGDLGYCIEKTERATPLQWEDARQACAQDGKRLPEPAEYIYACDNPPSGLINMTGNWEHIGNKSTLFKDNSGITVMANPALGYRSCYDATISVIATSSSQNWPGLYRCVR